MGLPQSPNPPHLYPHALQLKLYQAFIFSIPILFSIILILLFYLFYLKRRASNFTANQQMLPRTLNRASSFLPSTCQMGLKGELKDVLPTVLFDEDLKAKNSLCCVCLGEFERKEELLQVPSCKHVFHVDCIRHWLQSNSTCPLCRCLVVAPTADTTKLVLLEPLAIHPNQQEEDEDPTSNSSHDHQQIMHSLEHQQIFTTAGPSPINHSREEHTTLEESLHTNSWSSEEISHQDRESVVLHIQTSS